MILPGEHLIYVISPKYDTQQISESRADKHFILFNMNANYILFMIITI